MGLQELVDNFKDNGYKYLYEFGNEFYNRKADDLVYKLGIDKIGHRARIVIKLKEGNYNHSQLVLLYFLQTPWQISVIIRFFQL